MIGFKQNSEIFYIKNKYVEKNSLFFEYVLGICSDKESVCIVNKSNDILNVTIFDDYGRVIKTENKIENMFLLQVPITGMCRLKKIKNA